LSAQKLGAQPLCLFTTYVGLILAMLGRSLFVLKHAIQSKPFPKKHKYFK
jgi:hypothetical protein